MATAVSFQRNVEFSTNELRVILFVLYSVTIDHSSVFSRCQTGISLYSFFYIINNFVHFYRIFPISTLNASKLSPFLIGGLLSWSRWLPFSTFFSPTSFLSCSNWRYIQYSKCGWICIKAGVEMVVYFCTQLKYWDSRNVLLSPWAGNNRIRIWLSYFIPI